MVRPHPQSLDAAMANNAHRYRITVTPVESDGQPCSGRCTIEFEHSCHDDWMRILEATQRQRGFSGDERAALVVGTKLLSGLMLQHRKDSDDLFAPLRPHMPGFIQGLKQRNRDNGTA
ncbi:DUF3861 domain-containing protein [Pseudoxanthomonas wuyuanensis]